MSTSKGRGAAAHQIVDVMPPEQLRLLFLRPRPNQAIEFDPDGTDAIPRIFDEFDRLAGAAAGVEVKGELPADADRIFRYALLDPAADVAAEAARYRPAFAHLALLAQVPGTDVAARVAAEKGSALTAEERRILDERLASVRGWLDAYAPERARIEIRREALPDEAAALGEDQRAWLGAIAARRGGGPAHDRRRLAVADLRGGVRGGAPGGAGVRRPVCRVPGPDERATGRLAPRKPGAGLRRRAHARRRGMAASW